MVESSVAPDDPGAEWDLLQWWDRSVFGPHWNPAALLAPTNGEPREETARDHEYRRAIGAGQLLLRVIDMPADDLGRQRVIEYARSVFEARLERRRV